MPTHWCMPAAEPRFFQSVDKLPEHLVPTSRQVSKFSGRYLSVGGDPQFDWVGFKRAVDDYTGDDLKFEKSVGCTLYQQPQTVSTMMKRVAVVFHKILSASVDLGQLEAIVESALTDSKEVEAESGFLNFMTNSRKGNSSWQYRIIFSVPHGADASEHICSLVTTIKVTAAIEETSSWWGLASSTTKTLGARIDALQLAVQKGFRAPV